MSALERALDLLTPGAVLGQLAAQLGKPAPHLQGSATQGTCCDFRPGCEEENPSLSYKAGTGGPVFKRFGGDDFEGGALTFVESAGFARGEAVRLLLDWAGVQDEQQPSYGEKKAQTQSAKAQAAILAKWHGKLDKLRPLSQDSHAKALQGWVRLEAGDQCPELEEVRRRGLLSALTAGLLVAYRWTGQHNGKPRRLPRGVQPGALAFDVPGPDGTPWAVRVRNTGTKAELKASNTPRYYYLTAGQSSPAFVARIPVEGQPLRFFIMEGELNAAAGWAMLQASGRAVGWEVQGVASAVALPHVSHIPAGAQVYLYADADHEGHKARQVWAELLSAQGCQVYQLGDVAPYPFAIDGNTNTDACDALAAVGEDGAAHLGGLLLEMMASLHPWQPKAARKEVDSAPSESQGQSGDVWETKRRGYGVRGGKLCALTLKSEDGEDYESVEVLADFTARIVAEVLEDDGSPEPRRVFHIEGHRPDGAPLFPPVVEVPTAEFSGMNWPVARWGGAARIPSGQGKKDKARDAVQVLSNAAGYPFQTVYQHTGWIQGPNGWFYLTAGAVISAAGAVDGISVNLPGRLAGYALPDPATAQPHELQEAVRASLDLLTLAPDAVAVPLLGAAYRSVLGASDFVVWTVGETGKHKTAFTGLVMAHFGAAWSRRHLPDGWNSSANFLEVNAFRVKDALFVVDDFKPAGGAAERAKMDGAASRVIQGAADGAGRGTLTADRRSRAGLYPRGTVTTSAEDLPRGHSNRARLMVVEVHERLIKNPAMSAAYFAGEEKGKAGVYALAMAGYIQAVAAQFEAVRVGSATHAQRVRQLTPHFQGAHGRTGDAAAEVAYGWECFLSFAVQVGAIQQGQALELWGRVVAALKDTAQGQGAHLVEADPVGRAVSILSELLAQGRVYLADKDTGGQPDVIDPLACGWQIHQDSEGETYYKPRVGADLLGYVSEESCQIWGHFLPDTLHATLQEVARRQGGAALPDPAKLWGNMRDKLRKPGLMKCEEEAGGRVRYTAKRKAPDGVRRHFINLLLPLDNASEFLGALGTLGTQSTLTTSDTLLSSVPTLSISLLGLGTLRTLGEEKQLSSSPETWTVEL